MIPANTAQHLRSYPSRHLRRSLRPLQLPDRHFSPLRHPCLSPLVAFPWLHPHYPLRRLLRILLWRIRLYLPLLRRSDLRRPRYRRPYGHAVLHHLLGRTYGEPNRWCPTDAHGWAVHGCTGVLWRGHGHRDAAVCRESLGSNGVQDEDYLSAGIPLIFFGYCGTYTNRRLATDAHPFF